MKLVLFVVSVIAVFSADSRDIPVKPDRDLHSIDEVDLLSPDDPNFINENELLTEQSLDRDLYQELNNGSMLITDGFNFTGVLPPFPGFNFTGVLPPFPGFNFTGVHPPFTEEGEGLHEETNRGAPCGDRYTDCSRWKAAGFCTGYIFNQHSSYFHRWMWGNCPISCNVDCTFAGDVYPTG